MALRPCSLRAPARPSATRSRASSQPISSHSASAPVPTRRTGAATGRGRRARRRARRPWGRGSRGTAGRSGLPADRVTLASGPVPSMVSSRPQIASQRLQTPRVFRDPAGTRPSCHGRAGVERAILPSDAVSRTARRRDRHGIRTGSLSPRDRAHPRAGGPGQHRRHRRYPRRLDPGRLRCPGDRAPGPSGQSHRAPPSSVATTTHADGTQTTTEQRNQVDPPPTA